MLPIFVQFFFLVVAVEEINNFRYFLLVRGFPEGRVWGEVCTLCSSGKKSGNRSTVVVNVGFPKLALRQLNFWGNFAIRIVQQMYFGAGGYLPEIE